MEKGSQRRSTRFTGSWTGTAALTGIMALAALTGVQKSVDRYGSTEPGGPRAGDVLSLAADADGQPASIAEAAEPDGPAWDLPNLDHPRVDDFVRMFTTSKRGDFAKFLERSGRYEPLISEKLAERGMPQDLLYLAMIESGFNSRAYSHAHASGLWQFIAETGKRYGLDINLAVDERRDPVKATDAALAYLSELHARFGSWYLAAAAYNTGENRVGRIMREETGSEKGDEESYYRIRHRLPRETRDYVPLMVAAARISKEPAKYGFENVQKEEPLLFDEVVVDPASSLAAVARAAGTSVAELKRLNPHFKLDRTRNDMASTVRVPAGAGEQFAASWQSMPRTVRIAQQAPPQPARTAARRYQVRRGDNLTVIARRHGVTITALRNANGIRGDRIRAGQTLRIPG